MVLSKDLKIAICFGLIVGCLFSFCNLCFASEVERVSVDYISGISFSSTGDSFTSYSGSIMLAYFQVEPGYCYTITSNRTGDDIISCTSENIATVGGSYTYVTRLRPNESFTFNSSQYMYFYFNFRPSSNIAVTRYKLEGISGFIDQLVYSIGTEGLWSTFLACVPLLVIAVLWGLGFFLIVRFIIGIVKARGGI